MDSQVAGFRLFKALNPCIDVARSSTQDDVVAVIDGMRAIAARLASHEGIRIHLDEQVTSGRTSLEGAPISFQELWGKGFDVRTGELSLFQRTRHGQSVSCLSGLAHALLDPPYGLERRSMEGLIGPDSGLRERPTMADLAHRFCADVLAVPDLRDTDHLVIRSWPTDWCSYFDPGQEWWGSFLWTVRDPRNRWVTVIAASGTD